MSRQAEKAHDIVRSQGGAHAGTPWNESKHPRHAAGDEQGGEFASVTEGPKPGMTRLYRIEPKVFTDNSWLKKHLTSAQWADAETARGRLFTDNLEKAADYGHGAPTHNSFFVDVPTAVARASRRTHPEGWTEYLLPKEHASRKKRFA